MVLSPAKGLCFYGALTLLFGAWLGSELLYASRINPTGVRTVKDHFQRFGEPQFVYEVQHDGSTFYEIIGSAPSLLALPSSPPAYIYDPQGRFVAWCSDPGDQPAFRRAWRRLTVQPLDKYAVGLLLSAVKSR